MVSRAEAKYVRISPTKVRPVFPLIKGNNVSAAQSKLMAINNKAAPLILKVVRSAIANAKQKGHPEQSLYISRIVANPGPMLKRYRAASFGRATTIRKRTSHILVELETTQKIIQGVSPVKKTTHHKELQHKEKVSNEVKTKTR